MDYNDIKKYLEGKTSEPETEQIINWFENQENDDESRAILGEIWTNNQITLKNNYPDFDQVLDKVHHRINSCRENSSVPHRLDKKTGSTLFNIFSKVAAILILPLLLFSSYLYFNSISRDRQCSSISIREIYTKPGTRTKIVLPDGTLVWINDGTTFRYPERFSGNRREVYLDGEAYFEVKSNKKNPFIVKNPMMNTLVTGTQFNLNAYTSDQYFEATLNAGRVNLEAGDQKLEMKPGEQIQYDVLNKNIVQKDVDPSNASAWVGGRLILKNEKLGFAIRKLARWYNVEIIVNEPELNDYVLTGTFQDEKLDQTLKLISLALPVKFEFKKVTKPTELQRTIYMKRK